MSVEELNVLHRRYADLSDRFRAAWAFHQFVGSVRKIFGIETVGQTPADFQQVYTELKQVSHNLTASETARIEERLGRVERQLVQIVDHLRIQDERIGPSYLRKFFRRVKNADEKVITQLVKFYLYSRADELWSDDRIDKIDFLVTRIAEENGAGLGPDRAELRELIAALSRLALGEDAEPSGSAGDRLDQVRAIQGEVSGVEELEQLNQLGLVGRYRDLKHNLGDDFFEPELLLAIIRTNLVLGQRIKRLYEQEERRIVSEYQQVFDLERDIAGSAGLDGELEEFHRQIARFEEQLQRDEMKLADLADIRERVRRLVPKMRASTTSSMQVVSTAELESIATLRPSPPLPEPQRSPARRTRVPALIEAEFNRLSEALGSTNPEEGPRAVVVKPDIFPFRLEPREVIAYRRMVSQNSDDPVLESFILEAAALRNRINAEAADIQGLLDESATTGQSPLYKKAQITASLADDYLGRFPHYVREMVFADDLLEAKALEVLRMRLMRDYSGLWLLIHKPMRMGLVPRA